MIMVIELETNRCKEFKTFVEAEMYATRRALLAPYPAEVTRDSDGDFVVSRKEDDSE